MRCYILLGLLCFPLGEGRGFQLPIRKVSQHPPAHILSSALSLEDIHEFVYLVQLSIGNQDFEVLLDTGSSDLWVVSSDCSTSDCQGVPKYLKNSTSQSSSSASFQLTYLLGSVQGSVVSDTVTLGQYEISSQVFALANQTINLGLSRTGASGVLGLSFPATASIPLTSGATLLQNVFSGISDESQHFFSIKIGRDGSTDPGSSFLVGQLDPMVTNNANGFAYTNVSQAGCTDYNFWKLPLQDITINSVPLPISRSLVPGSPSHTPIAVLDTGTTFVLGPSSDVESFWTAVGASRKNTDTGLWEIRCERGVNIGFVLGEKGAEKEYAVHPVDINWFQGGNTNGWCVGGIQANDAVNSGDWLLGDVFLRNVYVTHHFATANHPPKIGLLGMTDPVLSLSSFRSQRGNDSSLPPSVPDHIRTKASAGAKSKPLTICAISSVCGFLSGLVLAVWFLSRRRRNRKHVAF